MSTTQSKIRPINGVIVHLPAFGTTGNTTSREFTVPRGAKSMTIFSPQLDATTSYKLQTLVPLNDTTDTWVDLISFDHSDGTPEAVDGLGSTAAAVATILSYEAFGAGILRIAVSSAQASAGAWHIIFGF